MRVPGAESGPIRGKDRGPLQLIISPASGDGERVSGVEQHFGSGGQIPIAGSHIDVPQINRQDRQLPMDIDALLQPGHDSPNGERVQCKLGNRQPVRAGISAFLINRRNKRFRAA